MPTAGAMRQKAATDRLRVCPGCLTCLKPPKSVPGRLGLRVNLPAAELRTQGYQGRQALTAITRVTAVRPLPRLRAQRCSKSTYLSSPSKGSMPMWASSAKDEAARVIENLSR